MYSTKGYKENELVTYFVDGETIDKQELTKRRQQGKGGYFVQINTNKYLDFYDSVTKKMCFASFANSALPSYPLQHSESKQAAFMNLYLSRYFNRKKKQWEISYKAMHDIEPNIELFGDYEPEIFQSIN